MTFGRVVRALLAANVLVISSGCAQFDGPTSSAALLPAESLTEPDEASIQPLLPAAAARVPAHQPNRRLPSLSHAWSTKQRAPQIGDIVTMTVNIAENPGDMSTQGGANANRHADELPDTGGAVASHRADASSSRDTAGRTTVGQAELKRMSMAAVVTRVSPDGGLVVEGRRTMQIDGEIVDLEVSGVVPADSLRVDHSIDASKMKQMQISYHRRQAAAHLR